MEFQVKKEKSQDSIGKVNKIVPESVEERDII